MQSIPIQQINTGPGSQPLEEDMRLLDMPGHMQTYCSPQLPEPEELSATHPVVAVLKQVGNQLASPYPAQINLNHLSPTELALLDQMLGEGEVSVNCMEKDSQQIAQESVFAGIWRVVHKDTKTNSCKDWLEIAPIPKCVVNTCGGMKSLPSLIQHQANMQNVAPILTEIDDICQQVGPASPPHTINLTLLPLSQTEIELLGHYLGVGKLTILSRGYGNCRIGSTNLSNVWWIKHFNSEDKLILNCIEISAVPEVALAAREDLKDSAQRVREVVNLYV